MRSLASNQATNPAVTGSTGIYSPSTITTSNSTKEYSIPEGVERIGAYAFSYMRELESLILPSSLRYIESSAFHCCNHLVDIQGINDALEVEGNVFAEIPFEQSGTELKNRPK